MGICILHSQAKLTRGHRWWIGSNLMGIFRFVSFLAWRKGKLNHTHSHSPFGRSHNRIWVGNENGRILVLSRNPTASPAGHNNSRSWKRKTFNHQEFPPRPGCASVCQGVAVVVDLLNIVRVFDFETSLVKEFTPELANTEILNVCHDPAQQRIFLGFGDGVVICTDYEG